MAWSDYESASCSIARTARILGDRWTVLVVRDLFNGVRRFDSIQEHLGVARDVLARRLSLLVDEGLAERRPVEVPGERPRHEYVLTEAGRDLRTAMVALMDWGDRHRVEEDGPPMRLEHRDCGAAVHAHLTCDAGHEIGPSTGTRLLPLAGARLRDSAVP